MGENMFDVAAVGEALIDFTPCGKTENGNAVFERNPGGATANVMVAVSQLGGRAAFIGKVGNDIFGRFLKDVLEEYKVNTTGLILSEEAKTTLAFVQLDENGDRSFSFYRNPGADMLLKKEEIWLEAVENSRVYYFSSICLTHNPSRESVFEAAKHARKHKKIIAHDVNLRPLLWSNLEEAKKVILEGLHYVDILKVSEEELEFLIGTSDLERDTKFLIENYGISMVFVTMGPKGCYYSTGDFSGSVPAYKVKVIDTTGAGDAFMGAAIYKILGMGNSIREFSKEDLKTIADFACAAGSLATQKRGAIPAMPLSEEVEACIKSGSHII
jgi:fructokinase